MKSSTSAKTIRLVWDVSSSKEVILNQNIGKVNSKGQLDKVIKKDTDFTITAKSHFGVIGKKTIKVGVISKPSFSKKNDRNNQVIQKRTNKLDTSKRKWNRKK